MNDHSRYDLTYYENEVKNLDDRCKLLVDKLKSTRFFTDPASCKYHHSYEGGLAQHSFEVYVELKELAKEFNLPDSTIFLIGIGHDLDKINRYSYNFSVNNNIEARFHKMNGMFHGEYSFYKLESLLDPSFSECLDYDGIKKCVTGHMADFEKRGPGWKRSNEYWFNNKDTCPMLVLTNKADILSCEYDDKKYNRG